MRVIGYVRVSTTKQAEAGLGLDVQERAIRSWVRVGHHRLVGMFRDEGVSGSNGIDGRVGLFDAMGPLRTRQARGLVVARLDRLARDLVLQEQILAEVRRLGADVFSTSDAEAAYLQDDPKDPSRKLIRQVLGAVAEYERAMITARLRAGRRLKADRGGWAAFGSPPFGMRAEGGQLVPDETEQTALKLIQRMHAKGMSLREIAEALEQAGHRPRRADRWHAESVRRIVGRLP